MPVVCAYALHRHYNIKFLMCGSNIYVTDSPPVDSSALLLAGKCLKGKLCLESDCNGDRCTEDSSGEDGRMRCLKSGQPAAVQEFAFGCELVLGWLRLVLQE